MTDMTHAGQPRFPKLVDITTAARLLGVTERYVRRLVAERRIDVVMIGHDVWFDLSGRGHDR